MDSIYAAKCLELIGIKGATSIFKKLPLDISAIYLRRMEEYPRQAILDSLPIEIKKSLDKLIRFPEGTAGAFMDPQILILPDDIPVKEALRRIRRRPQQVSYFIYIVNREDKLIGFTNLRELMLSDPNVPVSVVKQTIAVSLKAQLNQKAILSHSGWKDFHTLPVVDEEGKFLGVIEYQTLRFLELASRGKNQEIPDYGVEAALGELYGIGLTGFIKGVASALDHAKD
jgi:magnesium transporter